MRGYVSYPTGIQTPGLGLCNSLAPGITRADTSLLWSLYAINQQSSHDKQPANWHNIPLAGSDRCENVALLSSVGQFIREH